MVTYYPWSQKVLNECLSGHQQGDLYSLDLDLSAICTKANCIYCDSKPEVGEKDPNEITFGQIKELILDAKALGLKWVYTCGLGEPLEDDRFWRLVELLKQIDIQLSIFTNGMLIDKDVAERLYNNNVNLILKMDTFIEKDFDEILGGSGRAKIIYNAAMLLLNSGYRNLFDGQYTRLAFSIVPNKLSLSGIEDIVKFCNINNIFPSIGELEQAGRVILENRLDLSLTDTEIKKLKAFVDESVCENYCRPICPTIVTGLHIDNLGNCVVDEGTGLNCKWFLLKDPKTKILGNVNDTSLTMLFQKMKGYRRKCFTNNIQHIMQCESTSYVFGGCGGNPCSIIKIAKEVL
jgi:MoaA/NifB/PqqE/SkfB family radical SAM enzyme